MTYQQFSQYAVVFGSIGMVIGLWAQAIKIFKTKSAKDFSSIIVASLVLSEIVWLNYGLSLLEWPMIVVSCSTVPAIILIGIGYIKYRHGNQNEPGGESSDGDSAVGGGH